MRTPVGLTRCKVMVSAHPSVYPCWLGLRLFSNTREPRGQHGGVWQFSDPPKVSLLVPSKMLVWPGFSDNYMCTGDVSQSEVLNMELSSQIAGSDKERTCIGCRWLCVGCTVHFFAICCSRCAYVPTTIVLKRCLSTNLFLFDCLASCLMFGRWL